MGQNCVIGELSKYGIGIAPLLSDNYPFEMIAITGNQLFKIQVKTSTMNKKGRSISFDLRTSNWYNGTTKTYNKEDCDVLICYDLIFHNCFLLSPKEFENKKNFTIRYKKPKTRNKYEIHLSEDFIISNKRVKEVFDFDVPNFNIYFASKDKKYKKICQECGTPFEHSYKNAKYCSKNCRGMKRRKVERPSKEELKELINTTSFLQIGRNYGVSDNSVRKWAKSYGLI